MLTEEYRQPLEIVDRSWDVDEQYEQMFDYTIPTATLMPSASSPISGTSSSYKTIYQPESIFIQGSLHQPCYQYNHKMTAETEIIKI